MKVELVIKQGSLETYITLEGYRVMVETLLKVIKKAVRKEDTCAEIR